MGARRSATAPVSRTSSGRRSRRVQRFLRESVRRGAAAAARDSQTRGQDVEAEIALTLEEAHRGGNAHISFQATETCPECGGTGQKPRKVCPKCHGAGALQSPRTFEVKIPAGIRNGSMIRLRGGEEPGSAVRLPATYCYKCRSNHTGSSGWWAKIAGKSNFR